MTISHPGAKIFAEVSHQSLTDSAEVLGLPTRGTTRLISELLADVPKKRA